ncbi:hypothetical protein J3E69DRAFT_325201 [Trichoderma sp. SZMC 28015]
MLYWYIRSLPPPLFSTHHTLSPGYLHMLGTYTHKDAHTHYRCHCPALSGQTHSHPSAPLLPIRLAFSLSSIFLFFGTFCIFIRPQIFSSLPKARHRAVQTPTQERDSRPKSAHHQKKILMQGRERGGRELSSAIVLPPPPLLSAQLSFLRLIFSFIFDAFGGPSVR